MGGQFPRRYLLFTDRIQDVMNVRIRILLIYLIISLNFVCIKINRYKVVVFIYKKEMSRHYKNLALREKPETSRAGMSWDESEDNELLSRIREGQDVNQIAVEHKRTAVAVQSRILKFAIRWIDRDQMDIKDVCNQLHLTPEQISTFRENRNNVNNQNQNQNRGSNNNFRFQEEKFLNLLVEIRDLLQTIANRPSSA